MRWSAHRSGAIWAQHVGPCATVRDGSRSAATAGRSRRGEHPGARVSMAETLIGGHASNRSSPSDVRHSRRMTPQHPRRPHPQAVDPAAAPRSMPASASLPPERAPGLPGLRAATLPTAARRTFWNARTGLMCVPVPLQVLPRGPAVLGRTRVDLPSLQAAGALAPGGL